METESAYTRMYNLFISSYRSSGFSGQLTGDDSKSFRDIASEITRLEIELGLSDAEIMVKRYNLVIKIESEKIKMRHCGKR
jgi:hypothetical protein